MLITRFNRLIKSKLLWGTFAFLVVLSFALAPLLRDKDRPNRESGAAGVLSGEEISHEEFATAKHDSYIRYVENNGDRPDRIDDELDELFTNEAWKRIAALRKAQELGIQVTTEELTEHVKTSTQFTGQDGKFSKNIFYLYSTYLIKGDGEGAVLRYQEYIRRELLVAKLQKVIETAVWIPRATLYERLASLVDNYAVEYIELDYDKLTKRVKITNEDLQAYYKENSDRFEIPAKVAVKYVAFPATDYSADIEVSDDDVKRFYDSRIDSYTSIDSNGVKTVQLLDEVKDDIEGMLVNAQALQLAHSDANDLVDAIAPDNRGKMQTLENACAAKDLLISRTGLFSIDEEIEEIDVGTAFNRAAFEIDPTQQEWSYSYPVFGDDAVYVLVAHTNVAGHTAPFKEVKKSEAKRS